MHINWDFIINYAIISLITLINIYFIIRWTVQAINKRPPSLPKPRILKGFYDLQDQAAMAKQKMDQIS